MTEFIAVQLDSHINWAQKKKFWTGTQQLHRNFFINFIKKRMLINGGEWRKLTKYYNYLLNEYENHLMIHRNELSSKVLFEKVVTNQ